MKLDRYLDSAKKSALGGLLIGLACIGYVNCLYNGYILLGGVIFSFGLIGIVLKKYDLFTGSIGYIKFKSLESWTLNLICLLSNIFGILCCSIAFIVVYIHNTEFWNFTTQIATNKFQQEWFIVLLKSIGCGMIIYLAVDIYKSHHSLIGILIGVPLFLISGFEHCIANVFFFVIGQLDHVEILVVNIIGNIIGAWIVRFLETI